jgi:hypothetical protein
MQRLTGTEDRYRFLATVIKPGVQLAHTTQFILPNPPYEATYILALLSSKLLDRRFRVTSGTTNVVVYELEQLPFPKIVFGTSSQRRKQLAEKGHKLYQRCLSEGHTCVLEFVEHHLKQDENDVVHDLLAYLAQTMIDLNKEKQAEIGRFLGWLEITIGAGIDDLTGKTILRGYLGDYQKGQGETPFETYFDKLKANKRKLSANVTDPDLQGRIRVEYTASLAVLRPIKAQLQTTDALIDQIVYRLYGLTDEEIALVEGHV